MKKCWAYGVLWGLCGWSSLATAAENVPFMVYNSYAPYVIDSSKSQGVAYAVADLLSRQSNGRFTFTVTLMPRKRLDKLLETGATMVVPFVSPQFFADEAMGKFLWTTPLFIDQQLIVHGPANRVDYSGPHSLTGKRLGGIAGNRYAPLEAGFADGSILREDALSDDQNLAKLALGRLDAVSISSVSFNYLKHQDQRFSGLEASATPIYSTERRLMIQGRAELRDFIQHVIDDPSVSPQWSAALSITNP